AYRCSYPGANPPDRTGRALKDSALQRQGRISLNPVTEKDTRNGFDNLWTISDRARHEPGCKAAAEQGPAPALHGCHCRVTPALSDDRDRQARAFAVRRVVRANSPRS